MIARRTNLLRPLLWPWAMLLACVARGGEVRYYECTLRDVLVSGGDVVAVLGIQDGKVAQHAIKVVSEPYTPSHVSEHALKVDGMRLGGPLQLQIGPGVERIELDMALDRGGTYRVAYGCPDPPCEAAGAVAPDAPKDATSKQWTLWLRDAPRRGMQLGLGFTVDRQAKTLKAELAVAAGYNRGRHPVDASRLAFDGTTIEGEVGITLTPAQTAKWLSAWMPPHRQPIAGLIKLRVSLDGKDNAGSYQAVFGIQKHREGQVLVRPTNAAQMRALTAPVLSPQMPWRVWLATAPRIARDANGQITTGGGARGRDPQVSQPTPLPPDGWTDAAFDDRLWGRYMNDLFELIGGYGVPADGRDPAILCLRTRFGVWDPAEAAQVSLGVEYLGGVVVSINGTEVARGHLPQGKIDPQTLAEDYPVEAYTTEDGQTALPVLAHGARPDAKWLARYQSRVRTLRASVPAQLLVKGANVLTVQLHHAAVCGPGSRAGMWSHVGIREVSLTTESGAGLMGFAQATSGTRIWSAQAEEQVTEEPFPRYRIAGGWSDWSREVYGARGGSVTGIAVGNPFEPVVPLRIFTPRNGVGHAQVVLSDPGGLRSVSAGLAEFRSPGGATLPAGAVALRYGSQGTDSHWCDVLVETPPEGARTIPVWVQVRAPRDQPAGWYVSTLSLAANGRKFQVPVQVLVTGFVVPDARDFRGLVGVMHSPDALAEVYQVQPWSDAHFGLIAKAMKMAGQLGNDVLYVPVITGTHMGFKSGLIRWVKSGDGWQPDLSLFKKYLDLYVKHAAPPKAISLYVWSPETAVFTQELTDAMSAARVAARVGKGGKPLQVTGWDPRTGQTQQLPAPKFIDPGAEAFWKPLFDAVRASVVERGWSQRIIMAGCGGDTRPLPRTGEVLRQWAPYVRWHFYSHYVGDPGPDEAGTLIALGKHEVGLKEHPGGDESAWLKKLDYLDMPLQRAWFYDQSPPLSFRTMAMLSGRLGRVGLDFWPDGVRYSPLIWGLYPIRLASRGPDGPLPTVRLAMMRQAMQDFEPRLTILESIAKLGPDGQRPYRQLLDDLHRRMAIGNSYLSQNELGQDWPAYVARLYRAAEELTAIKTDARWDSPP
jgi:hypothetical protein